MAGVRVDGLRQTVAAMQRAGVEVDDLKEGFAKVGQAVVDRARVVAPTRTGRLDRSVRASRRKNGVVVSAGGARAKYAVFVAYGSAHNPHPVPFLELAVAATPIDPMVAEALNVALARSGL